MSIQSLTYDYNYNLVYKYRIEIYDALETQLLYLSDGFNPTSSNLVVTKINVTQAQWSTWDASVTIDDSVLNSIDTNILDCGVVMKIYLGKTVPTLQNIFYGIVDTVGPSRFEGDLVQYQITAKGFGVIANYTYVNFQKVPPPDALVQGVAVASSPSAIPFFAKNLVNTLWTGVDIMPLLDYTLSQRFGPNFSLSGISQAVNDFIPGINSPLVTAAQLMNTITGMSGAIWYVDENKNLVFKYPYGQNAGIIVKDYWEATDSGDYISYVKAGTSVSYSDSIRSDDGFANQLFAVADKTDSYGTQASAVAFTSLYNKNIAFAQIADSSKFQNMSFVMSKVGAGTDEPNAATSKVYGYIVKDNNQSPTGNIVAQFTINVSDITDSPLPIVKINRPSFADITIGNIYWIVLLEHGSGENNTIRVWHDDDVTTPSSNTKLRLSAQRMGGNSDLSNFGTDNWYVSNQGPAYSISFATVESILVEASDPLSIERWTPTRPVQARVTIPALKSIQAAQQYLQLLVYQTSQKIRSYDTMQVTIPNNLIKPGTEIQIASNRLKDLDFSKNRTAMVLSVTYDLDVNDWSIGSKFCSLSLRGSVDPIS